MFCMVCDRLLGLLSRQLEQGQRGAAGKTLREYDHHRDLAHPMAMK